MLGNKNPIKHWRCFQTKTRRYLCSTSINHHFHINDKVKEYQTTLLLSMYCFTGDEDLDEQEVMEEEPSSHRLAQNLRVSAHSVQMMKASFFEDDDSQDIGSGKEI